MSLIFPEWKGKKFETKYVKAKKLGAGGFAEVYRCHLKSDPKKQFAMKRQKKPNQQRSIDNIKNEVKTLQKLDHPFIVKFHDGFETDAHIIIVMELCTGGDMFEHIMKMKKVSEEDVKEILKQLLEALVYCHKLKIIHCDLKLENMIYADKKNDSIRVVDFGLAKNRDRFVWLSKVGGTAMYIAPECLTQQYTESVDIWAVGILAFEMMHGYVPFCNSGRSAVATIKAASQGFQNKFKSGKGPWWNKRVNISNTARKFILDCLHVDPAKRMTAAEALQHPWFKEVNDNNLYDDLFVQFTQRCHQCKIRRFAKFMCEVDTMHHWMIKDIKKVFNKYDKNKTSELTVDDFHDAIDEITNDGSDCVKKEDVDRLFESMSAANTGVVNIKEFLQYYAYNYMTSQDDRIWNMIKQLDIGGDGMICIDDVQNYLKKNLDEPSCVFQKGMDDDTLKGVLRMLKKGPMTIQQFVLACC